MEIEKAVRILTLFVAVLCLLLLVALRVFFDTRPMGGTFPIWIFVIALMIRGKRCGPKSGRHTTD